MLNKKFFRYSEYSSEKMTCIINKRWQRYFCEFWNTVYVIDKEKKVQRSSSMRHPSWPLLNSGWYSNVNFWNFLDMILTSAGALVINNFVWII